MAPTVADIVHNVVAQMLGLDRYDPEGVYNSADWRDLRRQYQERRAWYDGEKWRETIKDLRDDDGEKVKRYPLEINPISKMCRVHRAVMLGMQPEQIEAPPVTMIVSRNNLRDDEQRERAADLQTFVNAVWKDNDGGEVQSESCLLLQIYGGHVFRLNWEPRNTALAWRIALHSLDTPEYFFPIAYSSFNKRVLLDCYLGYMINPAQARIQFGITPRTGKEQVLYLEHWTTDYYEITVDGQVPTFVVGDDEEVQVEWKGENPWGFVPVVYVPHERDGKYYGRNLVDGDASLIGLSKELNARTADKGEMVQDARAVVWGRDITDKMTPREIEVGEQRVSVLDVGISKPHPGGTTQPELGLLEPQGYPQSLADYGNDIWGYILRQSDVAPVALGDDDTASGRITGPVTAYRMWPSMMHTMAERQAYSTAMVSLAKMMLRMALWAQENNRYERYHVTPPFELDREMLNFDLGTSWNSMIPIADTQRSEALNDRLQAEGISLRRYLELQREQDIEQEEARIWADRERQAMIEAEAQATVMRAQMEVRQQQLGHSEESR